MKEIIKDSLIVIVVGCIIGWFIGRGIAKILIAIEQRPRPVMVRIELPMCRIDDNIPKWDFK